MATSLAVANQDSVSVRTGVDRGELILKAFLDDLNESSPRNG
jgi:hypothetical protein